MQRGLHRGRRRTGDRSKSSSPSSDDLYTTCNIEFITTLRYTFISHLSLNYFLCRSLYLCFCCPNPFDLYCFVVRTGFLTNLSAITECSGGSKFQPTDERVQIIKLVQNRFTFGAIYHNPIFFYLFTGLGERKCSLR